MAVSKVIYGNKVLVDLTADSVSAEVLLEGATAHGADGEAITGTCKFEKLKRLHLVNLRKIYKYP